MSKYVGLIVVVFFALYQLSKLYRRYANKTVAPQEIRIGIRRTNYVLTGLFFLMGPMFLLMGLKHLYNEVQYQMDWVPAKGFVTEHVPGELYRGRQKYNARFHFQTSKETGAVDHEVLNHEATENPPEISSPVDVLYDPSNPDHAIIDSFRLRWLLPFAFTGFGSVCLMFAIGAALQISKLQDVGKLARPASNVGPGDGKLIKVKRNFFLSLKNSPSYRLIVSYQDLSGRKHIAESEPIWYIHPDRWANKDIDVPLAIDRSNPSRAWVRVNDYFRACRTSPAKS